MSPPLYLRLDESLDGETVDAELNVRMSKGLRGAVSAPAGCVIFFRCTHTVRDNFGSIFN